MAKKKVVLESGLPTAIEKRDLVYGPPLSDGPDLTELGDRYFEMGRLCEALDFYERVRDEARVDKIKQKVLATGDFFLLARVAKGFPDKVSNADFEKAGDVAARSDRFHYAVACYDRAGVADKLEQARARLEEFQPGAATLKLAAGAVASETDLEEGPISTLDD